MKQSKFITSLNTLLGTPAEFNTCNAWGFGGGVGHRWHQNGITVKVFTACFRHLPSEQVITIHTTDAEGRNARVFDELRNAKTERLAIERLLAELRARSTTLVINLS